MRFRNAKFLIAMLCAGCAATGGSSGSETFQPVTVMPLPKLAQQASGAKPPALANEPRLPADSWGLALSGGGVRSAAFSMGVISGLNEVGLLTKLSAISSVSGGGYAAYWYYMRLRHNDWKPLTTQLEDCVPYSWVQFVDEKSKSDLVHQKLALDSKASKSICAGADHANETNLRKITSGSADVSFHWSGPSDDLRWQVHLAERQDIFTTMPEHLGHSRSKDQKEEVMKKVPSLIVNSLFGSFPVINANLAYQGQTTSRDYYESAIERAYGLEVKPRSAADLKNAKRGNTDCFHNNWTYKDLATQPPMDPCDPVEHKDFPRLPVQFQDLKTLRQPMAQGKVPLWIINTSADLSVTASNTESESIFAITPFGYGSEKHGHVQGDFPSQSLSSLVATSGAVVDRQANATGFLQRFLTFLSGILHFDWGQDIRNYAANGNGNIHLSDGGNTDNLGVMSLLRRGVKNIIVVDGTYDRGGTLQDVCHLKSMLEAEKAQISFSTLKDLDAVCKDGKKTFYDVYQWPSPLHRGTITLPSGDTVQVHYLKLAWDQGEVRRVYNRYTAAYTQNTAVPPDQQCDALKGQGRALCILAIYYGHNSSESCESSTGRMVFPQYNTFRLTGDSSAHIFWALRELGKNGGYAVRHALDEPTSFKGEQVSTSQYARVNQHTDKCDWERYEGIFPKKNRKNKNKDEVGN